ASEMYRAFREVLFVQQSHGKLIERALIAFVNKMPNWYGFTDFVPVLNKRRQPDCLALNYKTNTMHIFECKRGSNPKSGDDAQLIDERLLSIKRELLKNRHYKEHSFSKCKVFILSFYGAKWGSQHAIYNR